MPDEYLSFEDALAELQMQEADLRALVSQGKLRAFRDENTLKFRRSDIDALRGQRETQPTAIVTPEPAPQPAGEEVIDLEGETELEPAAQPVAEEPIDLLAEGELDYDDAAETIIGGELEEEETSETELALADLEPADDGPSTKVPTIELTPTEQGTEETAVPTIEIGEAAGGEDSGAETEVPTMVLGLDEYDDTQVATEEVATEEVFIGEDELAEAEPTADLEAGEPAAGPEGEQEAEAPVGRITGSSSYGTGRAAREEPSALFTAMCAIGAFILLVPGGIFFYCMINNNVPEWGILKSIMKFFWEQFHLKPPPGFTL